MQLTTRNKLIKKGKQIKIYCKKEPKSTNTKNITSHNLSSLVYEIGST
jgi:hypothetical protein